MTTTSTIHTPRERVIHLLADYAIAQATLKEALAPYEAEATKISAAIAKSTAAEKVRLEAIEAELKKLALDHETDVFGEDHRTLIDHGWKLQLKEVEEVEMDADEETVCRIILRELRNIERQIEQAQAADDRVKVHELTFQRIALASLVNLKPTLNRSYIKDHADDNAEWFECFGLRLTQRQSASVKPAPKPRVSKAKKTKKPAVEQSTQEAA